MTHQLADVIRFEDTDYQIIRESNEGLFTPKDFGINPKNPQLHTGLYKGHLSKYTCFNNALCLHELHVICDSTEEDFPQIAKAKPRKEYSEFMRASGIIYNNIGIKSQYSGGLLVGRISTTNLPVHVNIPTLHSYVIFWELLFDNGNLLERIDYSDKMASIREKLKAIRLDKPNETPKEFFEVIKQGEIGYTFNYFPHWSNRPKSKDS